MNGTSVTVMAIILHLTTGPDIAQNTSLHFTSRTGRYLVSLGRSILPGLANDPVAHVGVMETAVRCRPLESLRFWTGINHVGNHDDGHDAAFQPAHGSGIY